MIHIESSAFSYSSLQSILIPSSVEILGSSCFSQCRSLSSITFESNSRLIRIESEAFSYSSLQSIVIPSTILFIGSDAVSTCQNISLVGETSCSEFDGWLNLITSGLAVDFRRILRANSGLRELKAYVVNVSGFEEKSMIVESDKVFNEIYCRADDGVLFVVTSNSRPDWVEKSQLEHKVENLMNVRHPCISAPIGFVFPMESGS
jgi:hypothetical protein